MDKPEPVTPVFGPRKVIIMETARHSGPQNVTGYFHTWGLFRRGLDGPWHTVAIVEVSDGTLHYVFPESMQFIDDREMRP